MRQKFERVIESHGNMETGRGYNSLSKGMSKTVGQPRNRDNYERMFQKNFQKELSSCLSTDCEISGHHSCEEKFLNCKPLKKRKKVPADLLYC